MLIRFELLKLRRSHRPFMAAGSLALFLALMLFGFYTYAEKETGGGAEFRYTYENTSYFNGLTFALYAFFYGTVLVLPIFAATEGGSQIAGETSSKSLTMLLSRPISKRRLFAVKVITASVYLSAMVLLFLSTAMSVGLFAVGWGDLDLYPGVLSMTETHQHLAQNEALRRFALAWPLASLGLGTTLSLSFLLSTWVRSPVNAVGTSVALYLVLYVISEIHFFRDLRPYLFTSYLTYWRSVFQETIPWKDLLQDAAKLAAFAFLFLALAFRRFRRREEG